MDFSLSDEQRLLIDTVRRFIREELAPLEGEIEATGTLAPDKAAAIHAKSRALGLYGMNIPEEHGGGGLSAIDTMLCEEQFGHTTDILIRRAFGNVYESLLACRGVQVERWLRPTVRGERVCSIAITEPGAGSDAMGITTRATLDDGGHWHLSGHKHFISDGLISDFFLVSAVTGEHEGRKQVSLFMVDKGLPGFTIGRDQPMMGLRGTSHVELWFDDVVLGPECLLGERGLGFRMAMDVLGRVRLAQVAARAVGKASHVLEATLAYAHERKQFGKAIADFQMIQQQLADCAIEITSARWMVLHAAWLLDQGESHAAAARDAISMVKVQASETLGRVVDRAVQIFGGMGYCKDLPVERWYRDARIYRIFDGTSEIHRGVVARSLGRRGATVFDLNR